MISADRFRAVCFLTVLVAVSPAASMAQERRPADEIASLVACVARESDYSRPVAATAGIQLLLTARDASTPSYAITGLREQALAVHVGKRVEVSGVIERPRTTPVLTTAEGARVGSVNTDAVGATGITPEGAAAHEPSDALTATVKAGPVPVATSPADPTHLIATLPRLNITSFRVVSGGCVPPDPATTASSPIQPAAARVAASTAPAPQTVTARGCLVRRTATGTALTAQRRPDEPLALTNASLAGEQAPPSPQAATPPRAFSLALRAEALQQLTPRVGERIEVTGVLEDQPTPPGTSHPSAPVRVISVSSFRPLGGTCQ